MPQRLNGLTEKCKILHIIRSSKQLLVVPYNRRRYTKDSIFNPVWAIQMDRNAHGADECTRNIYVNNE